MDERTSPEVEGDDAPGSLTPTAPPPTGTTVLGTAFEPFDLNPVLEDIFTYHAPSPEQAEKYVRIRQAAKFLAYVIDKECEPGADRTAAIRHLREAVMTANASIATNNTEY